MHHLGSERGHLQNYPLVLTLSFWCPQQKKPFFWLNTHTTFYFVEKEGEGFNVTSQNPLPLTYTMMEKKECSNNTREQKNTGKPVAITSCKETPSTRHREENRGTVQQCIAVFIFRPLTFPRNIQSPQAHQCSPPLCLYRVVLHCIQLGFCVFGVYFWTKSEGFFQSLFFYHKSGVFWSFFR